jgi:hypothetical protein
MSGSGEYTTTPNLGLFKPTYNADAENWGFHLNSNSDILDGALAGGGPFLPLTGGTVTGPVTFSGGLNVKNLPTSPTGLISGDIWSNGGALCVVP